ncbi:MAG: type II toxin-antitoxin system RelE/ParE family toxin [Chloroflexi bacterium]|uniref:Type II toxin-antitoxin system RelE/ParE family toxin n=1 Tax=Candidatus Chlorohelix allophototropha TaxID=3003348 RepID=A0A8T7MAQ3_9CHLR|nr:type II toxin-antitoxin system RelE/ParE family toxin [Chloroflexota bacterium]WJW70431.1 type II toxin-antitoxin system RelE/ParE family toxin [Chloroflexota bacterium L227-S17]
MPPIVDFTNRAKEDLRQIFEHWVRKYESDTYARLSGTLLKEIEKLAENPMLKRNVEGAPEYIKMWAIMNGSFRVYFERMDKNAIKVLRVYSAKRMELPPEEITKPLSTADFTASAPPPKPRKPQSFEAVLGEAPVNSVEYQLWQGEGILSSSIESRVEYLQNRAKRTLSADYKRLAIAYLQDELGKRRRGE